MKRSIILLCVLVAILLQGCIVKSLHPFYKDSDVIFKKELLNTWKDQDGDRWEIRSVNNGGESYELRHSRNGEVQQVFVAHLFTLDDQLYIDVFPIAREDNDNTMMLNMHLMPTHSIARVESLTSKNVKIIWLNEKWLQSLFDQNKIKISHEVVHDALNQDGSNMSYVLTASTGELQKFIRKYGKEDQAFVDDNTIWLELTR